MASLIWQHEGRMRGIDSCFSWKWPDGHSSFLPPSKLRNHSWSSRSLAFFPPLHSILKYDVSRAHALLDWPAPWHALSCTLYLDHMQKERLHRGGIRSKSTLIEMVHSEIEMKNRRRKKGKLINLIKIKMYCNTFKLNKAKGKLC